MEAFFRAVDSSRAFSITTEPTVYESLYLLTRFRNWTSTYNLCFPSKLTDEQESVVKKIYESSDNSPRAWIHSFCRIANESIDKLASDILRVKLSGKSKEEILRARANNESCVRVSVAEIAENISTGFSAFCKQLTLAGDRARGKPGTEECEIPETLSINNIHEIDKSHDKEQRDSFAQKNLDQLLSRLRVTPIAFWFMIYVITQMDSEEEQENMMRYLYGMARSDVIFNEETFDELERWKASDARMEARGTLNTDSMTFLFMFHRPQ